MYDGAYPHDALSRDTGPFRRGITPGETDMTIWLLVFAAMLLLIAAMAVGVLMGGKPIAGSCGGLNNLGLKDGCDICGGKDEECEKEQDRQRLMEQSGGKPASDLAYEAPRR